MQAQPGDITALLVSWRGGQREALDRLLPLIRTELYSLARRHLGRERKNHTMQPSSLVQEAFLRLLPGHDHQWQNRSAFLRRRLHRDASCVGRLRARAYQRETRRRRRSHST